MKSPYEQIEWVVCKYGVDVAVNALQQVCFNLGHHIKHDKKNPTKGDYIYSVGMALGDAVLAAKKKIKI